MIRVRARKLSSCEVAGILDQKRAWILRACSLAGSEPSRIIVFGSVSRDELLEDSDIDLALVFSDDKQLRRGRDAVRSASREDLWPLDLLFYRNEGFRARAERGGVCTLIRDEGRVIHDQDGDRR